MKDRYTIFQYIRNPEIRLQLFFSVLIGGIGAAFCMTYMPGAALALFLMWAALTLLYFVGSCYRYKRIAGISSEIDRILHAEEIVLLHHMEEGELCILENEINKMLCRLREQNQKLKQDKTYLADSLTDLSHQLRTPLTSMNLIVSMLEEENLAPKKRSEYLRKLQSLQTKVQWLIDVLLKISKLDADAVTFEMQSCNIAHLLREAVSPLEIPIELKNQTLEQRIKGENEVKALDDVSFSVEKGEFIAITGPSGSGKSTLLHILGGVEQPSSGKVFVNDIDVYAQKEDKLAVFRRREVGLIYQFYNLIPVLDTVENMTLPVLMDQRSVNRERLEELIDLLQLRGREKYLPNQLSGGQQQRVSIGRALMNTPAVVLADEPTGNLDSKNSQEIMQLLRTSNERYDQTLIVITHDENVALQAKRIISIEDGRIVRDEVIRV